MKKPAALWLTALFLLILPIQAQSKGFGEPDTDGQPIQTFSIDMNGDGHRETVALIPYNLSSNGHLSQIVIYDKDHNAMWRSPRVPYSSGQALLTLDGMTILRDPLMFGHIGAINVDICYVSYVDGVFSVVAAEHSTGSRPLSFRVLRWDGEKLVPYLTDRHFLEDVTKPDHYKWDATKPFIMGYGYANGRWITDVKASDSIDDREGTFFVEILEVKRLFSKQKTPMFRKGRARAVPYGEGLKISKWMETLAPCPEPKL